MSKQRLLRTIAYAIMALAVLAGMVKATSRWLEDKPEWSYYEQLTNTPLSYAMGPEKPVFGYLPGFKALLIPFTETEPLGFFMLLLLNGLSCVGSFAIIYKHLSGGMRSASAMLWLSCCSAVPIWFAIQNNQLLAPAFFLVLLAFREIQRDRQWNAGLLITCAVMLKTLPLPLLIFPLLRGQWKTVLTALVAIPILSIGLATATDGFTASIDSHELWPEQVMAQNPQRILFDDVEPESFSRNQSFAAEVARLTSLTDIEALVLLPPALSLSTLIILAIVTLIRTEPDELFWHCAAGWLAWVAFASPFGRYYYLLLIVPSLYILGLLIFKLPDRIRIFSFSALALLSISFLAARSSNPMYALATFSILAVHLLMLIRVYILKPRI